jgi:hypothetical protein
MRLFYGAFPNCDALRHELSWTTTVHSCAWMTTRRLVPSSPCHAGGRHDPSFTARE